MILIPCTYYSMYDVCMNMYVSYDKRHTVSYGIHTVRVDTVSYGRTQNTYLCMIRIILYGIMISYV